MEKFEGKENKMKNWKQSHNLIVTYNSAGHNSEIAVMREFITESVQILYTQAEYEAQDCASYEVRSGNLFCEGSLVTGSWELEEV
jgi:hypothetical protein